MNRFTILIFCLFLLFFQSGCCKRKKKKVKKPEKITTTVKINDRVSYELLIPEDLDRSKRYPLVFFLSPSGNPNIYTESVKDACGSERFIFAVSHDFKNNISHDKYMPAIRKSIEHIQANQPVHEKLIFLGGFSGGGQGSYVVPHFDKNKFRGIIVNSGTIHPNIRNSESLRFLGIRKVALLVGNEDTVVTPVDLRNDSALLQRSGIIVKMFSYSGKHQVAPADVYLKAFRWILK